MPMLNAFPNIVNLLELLGSDNDMPLINPKTIPIQNEWNLDQLEQDILKLTDEERYVFVCGDEVEMLSILKSKHLKDLDDFLNSAFDGKLSKVFYSF